MITISKDQPQDALDKIKRIVIDLWLEALDENAQGQIYKVLLDLFMEGKKEGVTQKVQDCLDTLSDIAVNLDELNGNMEELAGDLAWASI